MYACNCSIQINWFIVQEWSKHTVRSSAFGIELDPSLSKEVQLTLHLARVSLTERFLCDAVNLKPEESALAKDMINVQIRSWPAVQITFKDIHVKLWEAVQALTAGKPVGK